MALFSYRRAAGLVCFHMQLLIRSGLTKRLWICFIWAVVVVSVRAIFMSSAPAAAASATIVATVVVAITTAEVHVSTSYCLFH